VIDGNEIWRCEFTRQYDEVCDVGRQTNLTLWGWLSTGRCLASRAVRVPTVLSWFFMAEAWIRQKSGRNRGVLFFESSNSSPLCSCSTKIQTGGLHNASDYRTNGLYRTSVRPSARESDALLNVTKKGCKHRRLVIVWRFSYLRTQYCGRVLCC